MRQIIVQGSGAFSNRQVRANDRRLPASRRLPSSNCIGSVLANFPEGILCIGRGVVQSANASFLRLFDRAVADVVGVPLRQVFQGMSLAPCDVSRLVSPVPARGDSFEVTRMAAGTILQSLAVQRFPIVWEGARSAGPVFALAFTDETSWRESQRSTEVLVEELLRADRQAALGEMAMALAHELNQPLGAIVNFAGAARRTLMGRAIRVGELEEVLLNIGAEAARAGDVVKSLRTFLRGTPQSPTEASVSAAVKVVLGFAEPAMRELAIEFKLYLDESLPPIQGDPIILQQIILNLVTNAIQAMSLPSYEGRRLTIHTTLEGEGTARIDVRDTGVGLPPDLGERIFEPFITTKVNGSGLGLSIARTLAQRLGGSISAVAEPERGALFTIRLPCRREEIPCHA